MDLLRFWQSIADYIDSCERFLILILRGPNLFLATRSYANYRRFLVKYSLSEGMLKIGIVVIDGRG